MFKGFTTLALAYFGAPGLPRSAQLSCSIGGENISGATPVFPWSTLRQLLICSVATAGKEKGLEWLDPLREGTSPLHWLSPRAQRLNQDHSKQCRKFLPDTNIFQYFQMFDQVRAAVTVNGCLGSAGGTITKEVNLSNTYVNAAIDTD